MRENANLPIAFKFLEYSYSCSAVGGCLYGVEVTVHQSGGS